MSLLTSWLSSPLPDAAIQVAPECVSVAVVGQRGGEPVVEGYAIEPLPAGAVTPALTTANMTNSAVVAEALLRAIDRVGMRPRRVALVIPDPAVRVSLVRFDQVPARHEDLEQLLRWQIRKSAPFPVDDACLTFDLSTRTDQGAEFLVALARRDIVREYEALCEGAGMHAGLVDLATLSVVNLCLAGAPPSSADWLVIHVQPAYTSIAIVRGASIIFFRSSVEGDEALADMVHQTSMYYQDRLAGQGFSRVLLGGMGRTAGSLDEIRHALGERLGASVELVDPTRVAPLTDRINATPEVLSALAPLVGVMVRAQAEAVSA